MARDSGQRTVCGMGRGMATTRLAMTASAAALCVAVPLADAAAQEAHQCIVRRTDTTPADLPGDKTVSAYFAVPATAIVAVSASGWSEGSRSDATFGVEILKDNIVIARSSQQIGDGVLHAGVSAQITLA